MGRSVLVVEDEDAVRTYIMEALKRRGFTVLGASNGTDAVQVSRQHKGRIDVLLADMVLPGMPGNEVAGVLMTQRPELKPIFISGYSQDALLDQGWLSSDVPFLSKPFSVESMMEMIDAALEG